MGALPAEIERELCLDRLRRIEREADMLRGRIVELAAGVAAAVAADAEAGVGAARAAAHPISPAQREARQLMGRYLGTRRKLEIADRVEASRIAKTEGVAAALAWCRAKASASEAVRP